MCRWRRWLQFERCALATANAAMARRRTRTSERLHGAKPPQGASRPHSSDCPDAPVFTTRLRCPPVQCNARAHHENRISQHMAIAVSDTLTISRSDLESLLRRICYSRVTAKNLSFSAAEPPPFSCLLFGLRLGAALEA